VSGVAEVRVTRRRDVLEGRALPVLGRLRRHGETELLVMLPDGTRRLIRQAWTDAAPDDGDGAVAATATLGSIGDLLAACVLVSALVVRAGGRQEEAARKSPCKEDNRAARAAQSGAGTGSGARPDGVCSPARAGRDRGDHAAGTADREGRRSGASPAGERR
jgi:hypothetical protein